MVLLALVGWLGSMVGCASEPMAPLGVVLQPFKTCEDVVGSLRRAMIAEMNQTLDANLRYALESNGKTCDGYYGEYDSFVSRGTAMPSVASGSPSSGNASAPATGSASSSQSKSSSESSGGSATQASGTNNQVVGVDEADFIKNDKKYIYVLTSNEFRIIEAWPPEKARVLSRTPITGTPRKLFVYENRAVIYSSLDSLKTSGESAEPTNPVSAYTYTGRKECTYGYDCQFTGDGKPTQMTVFDITDLEQPKTLRIIKTSGSYLNARRIGQAVFTVLISPRVKMLELSYYPSDLITRCGTSFPPALIVGAYEKLRAANIEKIQNAAITDWVPILEDVVVENGQENKATRPLNNCQGFYQASQHEGKQFLNVLVLDLRTQRPLHTSTVVSSPGAVYASDTSLYLSVPHQRTQGRAWYGGEIQSMEQASTVHKFALDAQQAQAQYVASGIVKGRVLNQFAMDEYRGYLRMATTTGRAPSPSTHSTLTVLEQKDATLVTAGKVDHLAPSEDIRSARFDRERAYVVTFKKTDPLFVFDLADPYRPQTLAELKIPGFSTYMQMMDDNHLLSIGYDADDQGSFAFFTGVLLQIFDVSDPRNPKRTHREVIGTRGSSSEALTNHLAFNYFAAKELLSLPMTICEGSGGSGQFSDRMSFSGLLVYRVTSKDGFHLRGKVSHPTGQNIHCGNWWTDGNSQVQRSIIMDDYVFSVSHSLIKINHLDNLAQDVRSPSLE